MTIEKYFDTEDDKVDHDRFGFLRVRLSDDTVAAGYVSAYMVDGTRITVRSTDVLTVTDDDRPTGT
jgi:hypothetical protein